MEKKYIKIGFICFVTILLIGGSYCLRYGWFWNQLEQGVKKNLVPALQVRSLDINYLDIWIPIMGTLETEEIGGWDKVAVATDIQQMTEVTETQMAKSEESTTEVQPAASLETASASNAVPVSANLPALSVSDGITYAMEDLLNYDFLVQNCYIIDSSTDVLQEELDANTLLTKDLHIDNSSGEYKVLIYHTHGSEAFADSRPGVVEDTVIGVGDELTRILQEDYGIAVYHDRTVYDVIDGVEERSLAYDYASAGVDAILQQYPSIEVVLDIHRDGVREEVRLVREVDGVPTAQIMFLNGMSRTKEQGELDSLYNPYKIDNLAFSLQMHLAGKQMYGDLMRRIYVRGYCFNLNKMARSSLIEVGAQNNTVEEAKNAMVPLGAILYKVLIAQ